MTRAERRTIFAPRRPYSADTENSAIRFRYLYCFTPSSGPADAATRWTLSRSAKNDISSRRSQVFVRLIAPAKGKKRRIAALPDCVINPADGHQPPDGEAARARPIPQMVRPAEPEARRRRRPADGIPDGERRRPRVFDRRGLCPRCICACGVIFTSGGASKLLPRENRRSPPAVISEPAAAWDGEARGCAAAAASGWHLCGGETLLRTPRPSCRSKSPLPVIASFI